MTSNRILNVTALALAVVAPAAAQPLGASYTKAELTCMTKADGADAKAYVALVGCVTKCVAGFRKGTTPIADCSYPFGGATLACIADSTKGARAKAFNAIVKSCTADTPECWVPTVSPTLAQWAADEILFSQAVMEFGTSLIFCADFDGTAAPAAEGKCADTVAKSSGKLWSSVRKAYAKCKVAEGAGKIADGACTPPASDPATTAAVTKARDVAARAIDKACVSGVSRPQCHVDAGLTSGAAWAAYPMPTLQSVVVPAVFCGA